MSVLAEAALDYAQHGLYVFPLQPRGKTPLTPHGLEDATTDSLTIETWWARWPDANIGIRTGDVVVVDEDRLGALDELAADKDMPVTRVARTSSGRHFYFSQPEGQRIRNTAGKLAAGIDTRGDGGYVVAPPSIHPSGATYSWEDEHDPAPLPAWIAEQLAKPERKPLEPFLGLSTTPYGQRALEAELAAVALAPEGTRNETLNRAAFALGQLVAGGEVDSFDAQRSLEAAAQACGLPVGEAEGTIASGFNSGLAEPRRAPENGNVKPIVRYEPEPEAELDPIVFETLRSFLARDLPKAEALIGVTRDGTNLLPRYGWVMPWGREGSGKTSVLVDLIFHACAGIDWIGYPINEQLRMVAIINEGVPGGLQDKLKQKTERWGDKDAVLDNLAIYASPWGEFTFRDERMVEHARSFVDDFGADYVICDPLHTLGAQGAGAPTETENFKHRLRAFGLWQDVGVITAHHSNKAGMVSGDWGRHPDTLIHLEKDGKRPATKFTLQKARPADPQELGNPFLLEWEIGSLGYKRVDIDSVKVGDDELLERIKQTITNATEPPNMNELKERTEGNAARIAKVAKAALERGELVNLSPSKGRYLFTTSQTVPELEDPEESSDQSEAQTRMDKGNERVLGSEESLEHHPKTAQTIPRVLPLRSRGRQESEPLGLTEDDIPF